MRLLSPQDPIGTPVLVVRDTWTLTRTTTRSTVTDLHGRQVVWVVGIRGFYLTERVYVDEVALELDALRAEMERLKELLQLVADRLGRPVGDGPPMKDEDVVHLGDRPWRMGELRSIWAALEGEVCDV